MLHDRPTPSATAENDLFMDILHEAPLAGHRQPRSTFASILYLVLLAGYAAVAVAAPWIFLPLRRFIPALLCSCNAILLIITGVFQQYWALQVRKVRLQGYYTYSQKMKYISSLPFGTIVYGTAFMLLVLAWEPYVSSISLSLLLRIVMLVEVVISGCFISFYIGYIHKYNSLTGQPDALKSLYSALQPSSTLEEMRYHDGGRLSDEQMALLQYQRENLHYLSEEVLRLQERLSKYQKSDDEGTPQVDLIHLLASRDQEIRTLSAEMNQVHSELRLARSLIAERDTEVQRFRTINNQYVEENERLRAMLGEWSARSAKLERALEAERSSSRETQDNISKQRTKQAGQSADSR